MSKGVNNSTVNTIKRFQNMKYILILEGLLVGVVAGGLAILYRLALEQAESWMHKGILFFDKNAGTMALWFVILLTTALLAGFCLKQEPLISGSGIPQVEGEIGGYFHQNWLKVIVYKFIGGLLCVFGGLSLGREGPSIQLGAMAGKGVSRGLKRVKVEEKFLLTCGASAGLSAAFNAPLAGVMFALEEVHKNFSVAVLVSVMSASIMADFVCQNVFGLQPVFHFTVEQLLPLSSYWLIILLGILIGALGAFYNKATLWTQDLYQKITWLPAHFRLVIPFLLAGVLAFTLPEVLGSGHEMVGLLNRGNLVVTSVLLLLVVKFIFSLLSFGSGAPGGIFFPLLVLGSYIGAAFGMLAIRYLGYSPDLLSNFIILAMAGYFTAIVRAPITGIILICEMTGSFSHLLPLSLITIVAYVTADFLKAKPIYESLLERILHRRKITTEGDTADKILLEFVVEHGSVLDGKKISELDWPANCLLVAIKRGGKEIIPNGRTRVMPSDTLIALVNEIDSPLVRELLYEKCTQS